MYTKIVNQVVDIMQPVLSSAENAELEAEKQQTIKSLNEAAKIKLPIIGVFNAGKTTLVNSLLGNDGALPVEIVPETAIPCEIYPVNDGEESYAEIYRDNECIYHGDIAGYGKVSVVPGDYGKVYTTSPKIKSWFDKGIILVDMPGFDSGIEEHNRAIGRYMNQGTVFAFLMNSTHGSLRASELSLLKEVCQYGIKIGVFLTWSDAQTPEKNEEVKAYVEYQTQSFLPQGTKVGTLSVLRNDNADFVDFVDNLDVVAIAREKATPIVKAFISRQISNLKGAIALCGSGMDESDIDAKIKELTEKIHQLEEVIKKRLEEADSPEKSTQDVLRAARNAIKSNASLLAEAILQSRGSGTVSSVTETLVSIIRPALAQAFKDEQEQYVTALQAEISDVTRHVLEGIDIPNDILEEIINNNEDAIIGFIHVIADTLQNNSNPVVRVIGHVLTFIAEYIPGLIRDLFGGNEKVLAKIAQNVEGPVADAIISGLRKPVGEQVRAMQAQILHTAIAQYETSLKQMKDMVAELQRKKEAGQIDLHKAIAKYHDALEKLESIYNGI